MVQLKCQHKILVIGLTHNSPSSSNVSLLSALLSSEPKPDEEPKPDVELREKKSESSHVSDSFGNRTDSLLDINLEYDAFLFFSLSSSNSFSFSKSALMLSP